MMASAQVVETSVNTNNSPSQDYTTNPDDHLNRNTIYVIKVTVQFEAFFETVNGAYLWYFVS